MCFLQAKLSSHLKKIYEKKYILQVYLPLCEFILKKLTIRKSVRYFFERLKNRKMF